MVFKICMVPTFLKKPSSPATPPKTLKSIIKNPTSYLSIIRESTSYKQKLFRVQLSSTERVTLDYRDLVEDLSVVRKLDFEAPYWNLDDESNDGVECNTPMKNSLFQNQINKRDILGKGAYGIIIRAKQKGVKVAVKKYSFDMYSKTRANYDKAIHSKISFLREFCALGLQHENIVRTFSVQMIRTGGLVIMERVTNVSLQTLLEEGRIKSYQDQIRCAREVCAALNYCHENNILHLDVKPQNVLLDHYGVCKLTDFGCAILANSIGTYIPLGTIIYMAPELLLKEPPTIKSDIYSLGITMWHIMSGEVPYTDSSLNKQSIIYKVVKESFRPRALPPPRHPKDWDINEGYINIYQRCWVKRPTNRPTANQVMALLANLTNPNYKLPPLYYIINS